MTNQTNRISIFNLQTEIQPNQAASEALITEWLNPNHQISSYDQSIKDLSRIDATTLFNILNQALANSHDVNDDIFMAIKIRLLEPLMKKVNIGFNLSQATALINIAINKRLFTVATELYCDHVNGYESGDALRLEILIESFRLDSGLFCKILAKTPLSLLDAPITISEGHGNEWSLLHILANNTKIEPHRIESLKRLIDRLGPEKAHADLSRKQTINGKTGYELLKRETRATIMAHCQPRPSNPAAHISLSA